MISFLNMKWSLEDKKIGCNFTFQISTTIKKLRDIGHNVMSIVHLQRIILSDLLKYLRQVQYPWQQESS